MAMFLSLTGVASISIANQVRVNAARLDLCTEKYRVFGLHVLQWVAATG